jgi:hypothetical protein
LRDIGRIRLGLSALEQLGLVIVAREEEHLRVHRDRERPEHFRRDGHAVLVEVDERVVEHDEAAVALQVGFRHRQPHGERQCTASALRESVRRQGNRAPDHARRELPVELEAGFAPRHPREKARHPLTEIRQRINAAGARKTIVAILYVVGILSTVFHFANGLWTLGITWGLWTSPAAMRRASWISIAVGVLLGGAGLGSLAGMRSVDIAEARVIETRMDEVKKMLEGKETIPGEN